MIYRDQIEKVFSNSKTFDFGHCAQFNILYDLRRDLLRVDSCRNPDERLAVKVWAVSIAVLRLQRDSEQRFRLAAATPFTSKSLETTDGLIKAIVWYARDLLPKRFFKRVVKKVVEENVDRQTLFAACRLISGVITQLYIELRNLRS